jgi:hypothetical protein
MDKEFFQREMLKNNPYSSFVNRAEAKKTVSQETSFPEGPNGFLPFFFIELLDRFKNTLNSMKSFTHLSPEKLSDEEFRKYFYKVINDDIEEIESVINSLMSYVKINTPIVKSNTVHTVLEDILKKSEKNLDSKKIKVVKKFEKELPEIIVHEAQLRYVFDCILEFALPFTLPNGSIGFLTKVSDVRKEDEEAKGVPQREGRYVEIVFVFTGYKKEGEQIDTGLAAELVPKEEKMDLKLLLVNEIVRKNHGIMKVEVNEKTPKTQISLFFPVERRRVVHYHTSNA